MIHESIRRRADRIVTENITAFKLNVAATIEYELILIEGKDGSVVAAKHHELMAEIYQSILEFERV